MPQRHQLREAITNPRPQGRRAGASSRRSACVRSSSDDAYITRRIDLTSAARSDGCGKPQLPAGLMLQGLHSHCARLRASQTHHSRDALRSLMLVRLGVRCSWGLLSLAALHCRTARRPRRRARSCAFPSRWGAAASVTAAASRTTSPRTSRRGPPTCLAAAPSQRLTHAPTVSAGPLSHCLFTWMLCWLSSSMCSQPVRLGRAPSTPCLWHQS